MRKLINPDILATSPKPTTVEALRDRRVLTDASNTLELHHLRDNLHHAGLLVAYLPKQKLVIQADVFYPRPGAPPYTTPPPFTVNFYENIRRLKLDVAEVVNIQGGIVPLSAVAKAAGAF